MGSLWDERAVCALSAIARTASQRRLIFGSLAVPRLDARPALVTIAIGYLAVTSGRLAIPAFRARDGLAGDAASDSTRD